MTTMAMGFELIAVLNSTLCSMLGPGLALRGPDGSMHRAVDGLMLEYRLTFLFFTMGLIAFHGSALLFAWLEFSWPVRDQVVVSHVVSHCGCLLNSLPACAQVALAMTIALLMFIYGMGRYFKRIYRRFALESDRMITGKFEFGDYAPSGAEVRSASSGLGEVLSGGVAAMPAGAGSERQRTKEAERIIGLVEPVAPHDLNASASIDPSVSSIRKDGRCAGSNLTAFASTSISDGPAFQHVVEKEKCILQ